jgi:serine protease Do
MGIGEVGERLRRSTVGVRSGRSLSGSGVIWDASGVIVTNAHVVRSGDLTVELWDGRTVHAHLDKRDSRRDLAILRAEADGLESARFGDSRRVRVGQLVIAVGNPLGFTGALSTGVVHGVDQEFIQTTVRLAPGNSGGPLADADGTVIGINTAIVFGGPGLAVPATAVSRLMTSSPPVELGVTLRPVRIREPHGGIALLVLDIAAGSPADYASLRPGDVLIGAAGNRFGSVDDLRESLDHASESLVTIQFLRGDRSKQREVTVRLIQGVAA